MPANSRGSLLFHFHRLKGFPGSGALGYVFSASLKWLWRKFWEAAEDGRAVTHLTEVKLSRACEKKEEGLRKTSSKEGEGCCKAQLEGGLIPKLKPCNWITELQ